MKLGRRTFAAMIPAGAAAVLQAQNPAPEGLPQLSSDLVKDWIVKAHQRKIDVMKGLLEREPALLQSSWDWGAGDFESAIQAAAHTGSRDMALFLIDRGARFDLFAAAMLGQLAALQGDGGNLSRDAASTRRARDSAAQSRHPGRSARAAACSTTCWRAAWT